MPNQMVKSSGGRWEFPYTVTGVLTNSNVGTLETQNKFVDADINIKLTVPSAGDATLNLTDKTNDILNMGTATSGKYHPKISLSGGVTYETAGWVTTSGSTGLIDNEVAIGIVNQSQLKIGDTIINSEEHITAGASPITVVITEGYNESRSITVDAAAVGMDSAAATVSGSTIAEKPTIAKTSTTATGASNVGGNNTASTTAPSSGYFVSLRATAPETSITLNKTINTVGYLNSSSQITASAKATERSGDIYYLPITSAVAATDSADVNIYTTDGSSSGINIGNINGVIGTKATSEPTSGYYIAFKGEGNSAITTAGWIPTGSLNKTTSGTKYFPITTAVGSVTGTNTVTPSASLSSSNVTLSDTNNGISVTATGGGTASVTASANITTAGYAPSGNGFASATLAALNNTTTATKYISAITIPSGKTLTITNNGTATMTSSGTTNLSNTGTATITSTSKTAGNVTVAAYDTSSSSSTTSKSVVTNGVWTSPTVSAAGTYYGKVVVASSSVTQGTTTVSGTTATRGTASWGAGWINSGSINAATFANTATSGKTYVDISNTSAAPVLTNGVLYINKGYVDDISISLGQLIPDTITDKIYAPAEYIRSGYAAYGADGSIIAGTMPDIAPTVIATPSNTTYFTEQSGSSGASFSITPSYTNTSAGYLERQTTAQNGTIKYYKIITATFTGNGGNITLNTDTSQTNSIYRTGSESYISVESSAPAEDSDYVYVKVTGSGTAKASKAGWINLNGATATGSSNKYIKITKYNGSYSTT